MINSIEIFSLLNPKHDDMHYFSVNKNIVSFKQEEFKTLPETLKALNKILKTDKTVEAAIKKDIENNHFPCRVETVFTCFYSKDELPNLGGADSSEVWSMEHFTVFDRYETGYMYGTMHFKRLFRTYSGHYEYRDTAQLQLTKIFKKLKYDVMTSLDSYIKDVHCVKVYNTLYELDQDLKKIEYVIQSVFENVNKNIFTEDTSVK